MATQKVCNLLSLDPAPRIVIISTEMTEEQVIARIISNFTSVDSYRILSGQYRTGEEEMVQECKSLLANRSIEIHDSLYEIGDIEAAFTRARLRGGVDIGVIDYVQNCKIGGAKNEYAEQANLAKRFQKLAKDCRCTLLCLSQVSNDVGRGNTDQLELKGAGEWAAVSDVGVMLQKKKDEPAVLKYSVKKNRHGKLLSFLCEYKYNFTRIEPTQLLD
jgi:replicative DNA helicase